MRASICALTLFAAVAMPLTARADINYTVNFTGLGSPGSVAWGVYSFDEPAILTTATTIQAADFLSSTGAPLISLLINPAGPFCNGSGSAANAACVEVDSVSGSALIVGFGTPLLAAGTYGNGEVRIAEVAPPAVTPEPSTLMLLGTGLLGVVGAAARRRHGTVSSSDAAV